MSDALRDYLDVWKTKPVLRLIYDDFYRRIAAACVPGLTVELGGGIGNLKQRLDNVVSTDIQFGPWLDCVADAQKLPFADGFVSNIVMVDVLHHIEFPINFFREAARVLRPGGRIVMVEPAITWGSTLFYRLLHHEPVVTSVDPLAGGVPDSKRNPYDSNQAIPTLIATRDRDRFHARFPALKLGRVDWFSLASYPMSGGFKPWCLMSAPLCSVLLRMERIIEPMIGRLAAFRMLLIVEKAEPFQGGRVQGSATGTKPVVR
jgi:SAM-dependent methyltransferase